MNTADIFLLKFEGENIHPDSFSAKELGNLLIKIEDSIKAIIEENYPDSIKEKCEISLVNVVDESGGYYIKSIGQPDSQNAFYDWGKAIGDDSYINLPKTAYLGVQYAHSLVAKKTCNLKVVHLSEKIGEIGYLDILKNPEEILIDINTTIIGELEKIGGSNPKVWVKNTKGKISSVKINKEQAASLKPSLYSTVSLKVSAKWDPYTGTLSRLKLIEQNEYQPGNALNAIKDLRSLTSGFWDKFDSDEDINSFLRG